MKQRRHGPNRDKCGLGMDILGNSNRAARPGTSKSQGQQKVPTASTSEYRRGAESSPRTERQDTIGRTGMSSNPGMLQNPMNFQFPGSPYQTIIGLDGATLPLSASGSIPFSPLGGVQPSFFPGHFPPPACRPGQAAQLGSNYTRKRGRAVPSMMQFDTSDPLRWLCDQKDPIDVPAAIKYGLSGDSKTQPVIVHFVPASEFSSLSYTLARYLGLNQLPRLPPDPGSQGQCRLPSDFVAVTVVHGRQSCGFPELRLKLRLNHRHDKPFAFQAFEIWLGKDALEAALRARVGEQAQRNISWEARAGGFLESNGKARPRLACSILDCHF